MKKILLLIFFFLLENISFAQAPIGEYKIKTTGFGYSHGKARSRCGSYVLMNIVVEPNNEIELIRRGQSNGSHVDLNSSEITVLANKKIKRFKFYAERGYKNIAKCRYDDGYTIKNITSPYGNVLFDSKESNNKSGDSGFGSDYVTVHIRPELVVLNDSEKSLPIDKFKRTIYSHTDFDPVEYNWEYRIADTELELISGEGFWKSINEFQGKDKMHTKAEDFLDSEDLIGGDIKNLHGKYIGIRQQAYNYASVSKPANFLLRLSSPLITKENVINPSCYDSADGKVTLVLDRELYDREKISLIITNKKDQTNINKVNITKDNVINNRIVIDSLRPGDYEVKIIGVYGDESVNTYSNTFQEPLDFQLTEPIPVNFEIVDSQNVYCYGGNDGYIDIQATGGTGSYQYLVQKEGEAANVNWIPFINGANTRVANLTGGTYTIKVMDSNGCIAKHLIQTPGEPDMLGDDIVEKRIIDQPSTQLEILDIKKTDIIDPTFYGGTNGKVTVRVKGGTPLSGSGKYKYKWTDDKGNDLTHLGSDQVQFNEYSNTISGIGAGKYYLTIYDKNYDAATSKEGCTTISKEIIVGQPEPLKASVVLVNEISCNNQNVYADPSGDGALRIIASGGVPFTSGNNGQPYKYIWKKQQADGNWLDLPQYTTDTATGLSTGTYAVNVEDKNKIRIGVYVNNVLSEQKDVTYFLAQPELLQVALSKTDVCTTGDGTISSVVSGGVAPYSYKWSNGATTATVSQLKEGKYSVVITDAKGCQVQSSIVILPSLKVEAISLVQPTFAGGSNGEITVSVFDGLAFTDGSYTFTWFDSKGNNITSKAQGRVNPSDRNYHITLKGVAKGSYTIRIEDARYSESSALKDCYSQTKTFKLDEPDPLQASFVEDQIISCYQGDNGVLRVEVSGGVPYLGNENNRQGYKYYWKKKQADGSWKALPQYTTAIATGLSTGEYAVNVEDSKGIRLGRYENNVLVEEKDITYFVAQPEELTLSFSKTDVCVSLDGTIQTFVQGGVAPYSYKWSNGAVTPNISELKEGVYQVVVTDAHGCTVEGSIKVLPSLKLEVAHLVDPSFSGASNGAITVSVFDGLAFSDGSYKFTWFDASGTDVSSKAKGSVNANDQRYYITLSNLKEGKYTVRIEDARYTPTGVLKDCYSLEKEIELTEPDPLELRFELIKPISCHTDNEFLAQGQESDGVLKVHVTGGRRFSAAQNNGLPYKYTWKKQQTDGSWKILEQFKTDTASRLNDGVYAVNIEDSNGIVLGKYVNNQLVEARDSIYQLVQPEQLVMSFIATNECHNRLGRIEVEVKGGVAPYTYQWNTGAVTPGLENLKAGYYSLTVIDSRGCIISADTEILAPVEVELVSNIEPTFYKGTNGEITVRVSKGKVLADGSYKFQWKDKQGKVLNSQVITSTEKEYYELKLKGIGKGEYFLTIWDGHDFNQAINQCFIVEHSYVVTEPDPIVVKYEVVHPISCNLSNIYGNEVDSDNNGIRDEAQDGALRVTVTGGRPFKKGQNNDRPYKYTWKKQQQDGTWQELYNFRSNELTNLSTGKYALNVEDSNGIVLGEYVNNILQNKVDSIYYLDQPEALRLSFEKTDSSCQGDLKGSARAIVTGGVAPYTYQWSNGATTSEISDLISIPYYLIVYDSKGCRVEGVVSIDVPEQFKVQEKVEPLKCHNESTASISMEVSGGVLPYTYKWSNGATVPVLKNLKAGVYRVEVQDALGCGFVKEYTIVNPEEFKFSLGEDVTLCEAQTLPLDITIADKGAKYKWSSPNGFSSALAKVELKDSGVYTATITTSQGCTATSQIEIKRMNVEISSEFLITTQAYQSEEVVIVNVSKPKGDKTTWLLPKGVRVNQETEHYIKLVFDQVGEYEIGLREHQGDCYQTFYKKIVVEESSGYAGGQDLKRPLIEEFIITPVPNNGEFTVYVKLSKESPINLRLINYISPQIFYREEFSSSKDYVVPVKVRLASGLYILILETGSQTISKKIIIL
ncbi:hypothetical protein ACKLNQ_15995 [Myroides odoratimimus]|uniref:hypothetical protein n=1 Tax=Myroides odoratimimus TaxID=76832 RepID=UPI0038D4278B